MNLPDLISVRPDQTDLIDELATMVGTCFREEMWYVTWLDALDASEERKLEITRALIRADFATTAPYGCVYTLSDHAGAANVCLRSELGAISWPELEERATQTTEALFTPAELDVLIPRAEAMEPLSDTNWPINYAQDDDDFIYVISIGVDSTRRGSGAFRRLFTPFLEYADAHKLSCYLDCYTDRLEQLYTHFGFKTVERKEAPGFELVERCMVRRPQVA